MRYAVLALALTSCGVLSSDATAQQRGALWTSFGPTRLSCASFLAAAPEQRNTYDWWVLGFVSGANYGRIYSTLPDLASSDSLGLEAWVAKYCTEHPLDAVVAAAVALVKELSLRETK